MGWGGAVLTVSPAVRRGGGGGRDAIGRVDGRAVGPGTKGTTFLLCTHCRSFSGQCLTWRCCPPTCSTNHCVSLSPRSRCANRLADWSAFQQGGLVRWVMWGGER